MPLSLIEFQSEANRIAWDELDAALVRFVKRVTALPTDTAAYQVGPTAYKAWDQVLRTALLVHDDLNIDGPEDREQQ